MSEEKRTPNQVLEGSNYIVSMVETDGGIEPYLRGMGGYNSIKEAEDKVYRMSQSRHDSRFLISKVVTRFAPPEHVRTDVE